MRQLQILVVFVLVAIAIMRHVDIGIESGEQAIAGILYELSETELPTSSHYDAARRNALQIIRREHPELEFSPPSWFIELMGTLSSADPGKVRKTFQDASERLGGDESDRDYQIGREAVRRALEPPEDDTPNGGKCEDCDGTGKVGDGRVFTTCLACDGTGILKPKKGGDEVSRQPSVNGNRSSCDVNSSRPLGRSSKSRPVVRFLQRVFR